MERRASRLRRGLIYAAVAALGGAVVPGVAACVVAFTGGDVLGLAITAAVWGGFFGIAGFMVGACQPAPRDRSSIDVADIGPRWTVGRCAYLLVAGGLLGFITSHVAAAFWIAVFFSLEGWDLTRPGRTRWDLFVDGLAFSAYITSSLAALLSSILGAFFGSTVRTSRPRPPVMRTSLYAGALAIVVASALGWLPGAIWALDLIQIQGQAPPTGITVTVFAGLVLEIAVLSAIVGAWTAWRLVRMREPAEVQEGESREVRHGDSHG